MTRRVSVSVDDRGIARLAMDDARGKNAFSRPFVAELRRALAALSDDRVRACVLTGLPDVFSAGGDLDVLIDLAERRLAPYDLDLCRDLLDVPIPVVAAMEGHAVGGGLVFGLCCDAVVLARESRYGCNFMDLGFTPGMGATTILRDAVGDYLAAEMMFGARTLRGSRLEGRARVNDVVPKVDVLEHATAIAASFVDKPRAALAMLKRTLSLPKRRAFEEARTLESFMHEACFGRAETIERIRERYVPVRADTTQEEKR